MSNYIYSTDPGTAIANLCAGFGHAGATPLINDASGTYSTAVHEGGRMVFIPVATVYTSDAFNAMRADRHGIKIQPHLTCQQGCGGAPALGAGRAGGCLNFCQNNNTTGEAYADYP